MPDLPSRWTSRQNSGRGAFFQLDGRLRRASRCAGKRSICSAVLRLPDLRAVHPASPADHRSHGCPRRAAPADRRSAPTAATLPAGSAGSDKPLRARAPSANAATPSSAVALGASICCSRKTCRPVGAQTLKVLSRLITAPNNPGPRANFVGRGADSTSFAPASRSCRRSVGQRSLFMSAPARPPEGRLSAPSGGSERSERGGCSCRSPRSSFFHLAQARSAILAAHCRHAHVVESGPSSKQPRRPPCAVRGRGFEPATAPW